MNACKDHMIAFKASRHAQTLMAHLSVLVTTGIQVTERQTASQQVRIFSSSIHQSFKWRSVWISWFLPTWANHQWFRNKSNKWKQKGFNYRWWYFWCKLSNRRKTAIGLLGECPRYRGTQREYSSKPLPWL